MATSVYMSMHGFYHWKLFLNYQFWYFKTNILHTPSGNLYLAGALLYICSRHLANYWGAKVCLGMKNTKGAFPFFLPRNMKHSMASGGERYMHCFFFLSFFFFKHSVVNTLKTVYKQGAFALEWGLAKAKA